MFLVGLQGKLTNSYSITYNSDVWAAEGELRGGFVVADSAAIYGAVGAEGYSTGLTYDSLGVGLMVKAGDNVGVDVEYKHFWPMAASDESDAVTASVLWFFK